ncbi:Uu.00g079920.m01.CDS01 [Anthostomella pinea]|uniref:Uu.00g079920.m01.CDS01 n=1 Tax=Anthostomella pinea TaxID=933095 RepID=A0AAI8VLU9_9PEZI|nr:Uu.00g079920.m01.CDS01 [Anthostomella pinea]
MGWQGQTLAITNPGPLDYSVAMLTPRSLRLYTRVPGSPVEQRTYPRRLRRAILLAFILAVAWLACKKLASVDLTSTSYEFMRAASPDAKASRWVGGGAIASLASQTHRDRPQEGPGAAKGEKNTLYQAVPEVVRIPFEEAVQDVELQGWEDEWFSSGNYNIEDNDPLAEAMIDFVYNWVNGSDQAFKDIRHAYELGSPLNDHASHWIAQHSINRYRDWDELRYSLRSLDAYAEGFVNKIQLLVNSVGGKSYHSDGESMHPQRPSWLKDDDSTSEHVQVLGQESFFRDQERKCLPTFNSLSIESQIYMMPSSTDQLVALSDDVFLGMTHAASDFYSPLFGPAMGFKSDHYNVKSLGGKDQVPSFGEKPFVYYTSYLLNHRFGQRNRHVQAHIGHSVSRAVMKEAMASFPQPSAKGSCERFRGESRFQIYPWYASFHYSIERFREALLWSLVMSRSDINSDGYLDWTERQHLLDAVEPGWRQLATKDTSKPAAQPENRDRMYYNLPQILRDAGLGPTKVNLNVLWTSLDGPETIRNVKCNDFSVDKCLGDSFASSLSDMTSPNPDFATSNVFSRLSHQHPQCGDCLLKFLLASTPRGLEPLLPPRSKPVDCEMIVKVLKKYQHTIIDTDAMKFVMIKDAEQAETELLERTIRKDKVFGQWCLNDDVMTENASQVGRVKEVMGQVFETLWPKRGTWEKDDL